MNRAATLIFVILLLTTAGLKQSYAQTDTDFWFAVPKVTKGHSWAGARFFFRFANLNLPNQIMITMPDNPGFTPIIANLTPFEARTIDVTTIIEQIWIENPNQVYNRGIHIVATNLTTAYFEIGTINNPDIFSLKGRNALGTDFFVPFQNRFHNGNYNPKPYSGIYMVATEDNTKITITPTRPVFPDRPAGVPFQITLNRGEAFAVVPNNFATSGQFADNHLGGTRVESTKPIAISTSDDSVDSANPSGWGGCRDLIGDQLIPTSIIGTEYIAMRGRIGQGGAANMPEFFYVVGTKPNTEVLIDGNLEAIIQPGQQYRRQFSQKTHFIKVSQPAYVYHVSGFGCEMGGAVLPPVNVCTGSTRVSFTRSKNEGFFLNILVRAGAEDAFIFNGQGPNTVIKASDFKVVPGTTSWLAAEFDMTNVALVPVGLASLIENTKDVFHLGIINGGPGSGTMYGYFSDFNELSIRANISGAGSIHRACPGEPVQLIAQGGINYTWSPPDFLDDPKSATPIALPEASIKYTVMVSGACKMVDSTSVYVTLFGPANAAFTVDEAVGCSPFDVKIKNESYGLNRYSWRMGDGTIYTNILDNFTHTYVNNTNAPIKRRLMLVGMFSHCRDTMFTDITVYPEVKASIKPNVISGCAPLEVNFSNLSKGAEKYHWRFGDGASSTLENPVHTFHNYTDKEITYEVTLNAISKNGCLSEDIVYIHVKPFVETKFSFDPPTHCTPYPVTFQNRSFGATDNLWSFDNGSTFEKIDQAEFSKLFENKGFSLPDTIKIWLRGENNYGCSDTQKRQLVVFPSIISEFKPSITEGCNPQQVSFQNLSRGAKTYLWEFGNQEGNSSEKDPVIWFNNPSLSDTAVFNVRLTTISDYLCQDVSEHQIKVYPRIEAGFTFDYTSYCTPQELTFNNQSKGANLVSWDFGTGAQSYSNQEKVSHVFENKTGAEITVPVTLTIENSSGCKDALTRSVTIYPEIKAQFEMISSGCHPLEVEFINQSNGAAKYLWEFGDGGTSAVTSVKRIYTNPSRTESQVYIVRLSAESQFGCKDYIEKQITVFPKPKASYRPSDVAGCSPLPVQFIESSVGTKGFIWNFGDGSANLLNSGNISHTYTNKGDAETVYTSRLIALNEYGCMDTTQMSTRVFPEIKAEFSLSETMGCHPLETRLVNESSGASANTPYRWIYGDGQTSTTSTVAHKRVFNNPSHTEMQQYTIRLHAQSIYGCKDSIEKAITVFPRPKAVFEPSITEGCSPLEIAFTDSSSGATQYNWNFANGYTSNNVGNITHRFTQPLNAPPGVFPVVLDVENQFGCTSSAKRTITVFPDIVANFDVVTEGCHPLQVQFNNQSRGAKTNQWSFGDGSTSIIINPSYTFTNESHTDNKYYNINLNVTSNWGCKADASRQITVYPRPKSAFTIHTDEGCSPLPLEFTNLSIGGTLAEWSLAGTQTVNNAEKFTHSISNKSELPAIYQLKLKTINKYGCSRESSQQVKVFPEVIANFTADNEAMKGCNPLPLEFINLSRHAHRFAWNFADGNNSTVPNPKNEFYTPPTKESFYDIKLRAQSVFGCLDSIVKRATVYPVPVADILVSPHAQTFPSTHIRAENFSSPGNWKFRWELGDGRIINTDTFDTIDHEYKWPSDDYSTKHYRVSLTVANDYCFDSISQKVSITAPMPMVGFAPSAQGCPPLEIQFRNDSKYGKEFFWDFADGHYSNLENPVHVFTKPGEYQVKLLVSGEGGLDSAYQTIRVFELPNAEFRVSQPVVQLPYETIKMVNLSSLATYFEWHMGDGTIYYDTEPEHLYSEAGVYDIRLNVATNTFPQCFDQVVKKGVVIAEKDCQMIFPNAFTPSTNGPSDGRYIVNDPANHIFYPIHTGIDKYVLEIYNRWGEFIFRSEDTDIGWDGYYRGRLSPMGVYVWKVKATCFNGKEIKTAGDVTLYR